MVTVSEVLAAIQPFLIENNKINPNTPLQTSYGTGSVYVYKIPGTNPPVLVYQSSGAVDCDGVETSQCNINTDSAYQNDTSFHTSNNQPLNAAVLPFYVLPIAGSSYFDYTQNDINGGQLALVMYGNNMNYGVLGDENADERASGEISYAMASSLGINPDPSVGGVESGVTYIIFTSSSNIVSPIEDHNSAVSLGNNSLDLLMSQISAPPINNYGCVNGQCLQGYGNLPAGCNNACTSPPPITGCINCDLTKNYCVAGTCIPKNYVIYGGVALGGILLLKLLK